MNEQETKCIAANQPSADPTIEKIRQMLAARNDVACAYLFGSRATGTAKEDSDYDIGVVTTGTTPGDRLEKVIASNPGDFHSFIEIVLKSDMFAPRGTETP